MNIFGKQISTYEIQERGGFWICDDCKNSFSTPNEGIRENLMYEKENLVYENGTVDFAKFGASIAPPAKHYRFLLCPSCESENITFYRAWE